MHIWTPKRIRWILIHQENNSLNYHTIVNDIIFSRKILIWLLDFVLWLWIWLSTNKFDSISSSILKCNNWKMKFETWRIYWSESLRILVYLKYVLVCSLCVRLFIADVTFFWRMKILEVLFLYVPCHASTPYDKCAWISEVYT